MPSDREPRTNRLGQDGGAGYRSLVQQTSVSFKLLCTYQIACSAAVNEPASALGGQRQHMPSTLVVSMQLIAGCNLPVTDSGLSILFAALAALAVTTAAATHRKCGVIAVSL